MSFLQDCSMFSVIFTLSLINDVTACNTHTYYAIFYVFHACNAIKLPCVSNLLVKLSVHNSMTRLPSRLLNSHTPQHVGHVHYVNNVTSVHEDFHPRISSSLSNQGLIQGILYKTIPTPF